MNKEQFSTDVIEPLGLIMFSKTGSVYFDSLRLGNVELSISGKVTRFNLFVPSHTLKEVVLVSVKERTRVLLTVLSIHGIPVIHTTIYQYSM